MVIFLSVLVEPMVEMANVLTEKIILGSALSNACRAAKDTSLKYDMHRGLDAELDQDSFRNYFSDAFESSMNVTGTATVGNIMTFTSNDGKYNTFYITLDINERIDDDTEQTVTEVGVKAETIYKFRTKYLKLAEAAGQDVDYRLVSERMLLLSVKN